MSRILSDWIEGYLEYTDSLESPMLFRKWVAVGTVAAALQRKVIARVGIPKFYPNMYIVITAPPGFRKGTAMKPAIDILSKTGIKIAANTITREGLVRALKNSQEYIPDQITGGTTHCSLTVFSEEMNVFLGQGNIPLMTHLNDWFDCADHWVYGTKDEKLQDEINGLWLNLIAATTPANLKNALPSTSDGTGLLSRMLFVFNDTERLSKPIHIMTQRELELEEILVHDLGAINLLKGEFRYTEEFLDLYIPWYDDNRHSPVFQNTILASYAERRGAYLVKLMMVLSAARSDKLIIEKQDFDKGVKWLLEIEKSMPKVFEGFGRNPNADLIPRLMKFIADVGHTDPIPIGIIAKTFYQDADTRTLESALLSLRSMGWIKFENGGRTIIYTGKPNV